MRKRFRVEPGCAVDLDAIDPAYHGRREDDDVTQRILARDLGRLDDVQYLLYAGHARSLLIVLQGPDASGKDGTIRHVFGPLNPQGVRVQAFKVPTPIERDHDFLWRVHPHVPAKGEIVIFNRSHYEDVLVPRVHDQLPKKTIAERYDAIRAFERTLAAAGTVILKFYLHISPQEQLRRFEQRLDDPKRQWKISEDDYREREYFAAYRRAAERALRETSTEEAPWFVVPADHKWFRNLAVAKIVLHALDALDLHVPPPTVDLDALRRTYHT